MSHLKKNNHSELRSQNYGTFDAAFVCTTFCLSRIWTNKTERILQCLSNGQIIFFPTEMLVSHFIQRSINLSTKKCNCAMSLLNTSHLHNLSGHLIYFSPPQSVLMVVHASNEKKDTIITHKVRTISVKSFGF